MTKEFPKSKITSPIDFRIIALIVGLAVGFQAYLYLFWSEEADYGFYDITYSLGSAICAVMAFLVARRYWGSQVFGTAYSALGIAFVMLLIGDIGWQYYEFVLEIDPYPSLADIFHWAYYPFAIFHLVRNITYFRRNIKNSIKIGLGVISAIIILAYSYISLTDLGEANFDFYFGLLFVVPSGIIFSLAVLGILVFKDSVLGTAWLLLATGIFIFSITDVWYYYLELFEGYAGAHPTNTLWMLAFMTITYALYKHQKVI